MKEKSDSESSDTEEENNNNINTNINNNNIIINNSNINNNINNSNNIDFFLKEKEDPLKVVIKEEKKSIEIENKEKGKKPIEIENKEKGNKIVEIENKEKEEEIVFENYEEELKDRNLEEIKMGKKIICPEDNCFENTIINLDPITFEIKSDCGKHPKKMKIIDFVEKSGNKEEKDFCYICKNTYKDILDNKKILYKCYCGENLCEDCKENHLKEKDLEKHNIVDFKIKDYTCCCNDTCKKYICFCLDCKKNLCVLCRGEHKEHTVKDFSKLYKLGKEEKKEINKKLKEQKEKIKKFKNIIDNWLIRITKIINIYKKKLDLYWEINNIIFNNYNIKNNYYEEN